MNHELHSAQPQLRQLERTPHSPEAGPEPTSAERLDQLHSIIYPTDEFTDERLTPASLADAKLFALDVKEEDGRFYGPDGLELDAEKVTELKQGTDFDEYLASPENTDVLTYTSESASLTELSKTPVAEQAIPVYASYVKRLPADKKPHAFEIFKADAAAALELQDAIIDTEAAVEKSGLATHEADGHDERLMAETLRKWTRETQDAVEVSEVVMPLKPVEALVSEAQAEATPAAALRVESKEPAPIPATTNPKGERPEKRAPRHKRAAAAAKSMAQKAYEKAAITALNIDDTVKRNLRIAKNPVKAAYDWVGIKSYMAAQRGMQGAVNKGVQLNEYLKDSEKGRGRRRVARLLGAATLSATAVGVGYASVHGFDVSDLANGHGHGGGVGLSANEVPVPTGSHRGGDGSVRRQVEEQLQQVQPEQVLKARSHNFRLDHGETIWEHAEELYHKHGYDQKYESVAEFKNAILRKNHLTEAEAAQLADNAYIKVPKAPKADTVHRAAEQLSNVAPEPKPEPQVTPLQPEGFNLGTPIQDIAENMKTNPGMKQMFEANADDFQAIHDAASKIYDDSETLQKAGELANQAGGVARETGEYALQGAKVSAEAASKVLLDPEVNHELAGFNAGMYDILLQQNMAGTVSTAPTGGGGGGGGPTAETEGTTSGKGTLTSKQLAAQRMAARRR